VLKDLHDRPTGGHFARETIAHKVLRDGYYSPTLFQDAHAYVRKCKICQVSWGREKKASIPLQPITISRAFEQWGIDIIGEVNPYSLKQHKYSLTTTSYFTHWFEAIPLT